jgi:hypothetical protein
MDDVRHALEKLQEFREHHGIAGVIDARIGGFSEDEKPIAELLASEGHNVAHIPPKKSGVPSPDMAIGAAFVEVKTSTGGSLRWFRKRLIDGQADRQIINIRNSRIAPTEVQEMVGDLVDQGVLSYARIIGNDLGVELGRWT